MRSPDRAELVDDARHQRNFRSDDGKIGIDGTSSREIVRWKKLSQLRDARIAGRREDLHDLLAPDATRSRARARRFQ